MNAEDLNDICGRAVRGAPIDADHVLEIIADLTAARAELAAAQAITARVRKILRAANSFREAYYAITAAVGEEQP